MKSDLTVVIWGTYDLGKPRVRILLRGLSEAGVKVISCHADVWSGIEDKSQIFGLMPRLRLLIRWLAAYPLLVVKYLRLQKHDVVLIPYMGHLDVLVLWLFAKYRKTPVVWDVFIPLHNAIVEDRRLVQPRSLVAKGIYFLEALACRLSDEVFLDTKTHAEHFCRKYKKYLTKASHIYVGVELESFPVSSPPNVLAHDPVVLFYGQFIPLHGIETIVRAAAILRDRPIEWVLIGSGQESAAIKELLQELAIPRLRWIEWVPYQDISNWIDRSDVCLGVFSSSVKASVVIPNKVLQIIASGRTLVTRESDAIKELFNEPTDGLYLVPPDDPVALANAIVAACAGICETRPFAGMREKISPMAIGASLKELLQMVVDRRLRGAN